MNIVTVCRSKRGDIFACAQAGCPDCLEALLRGNEGLIHHILKRQGIGGIEYQDLIQEGRIALWRSILHYDPGRGTAFSTYAGFAIYHQFWRYVEAADQSGGYEPSSETKPTSMR